MKATQSHADKSVQLPGKVTTGLLLHKVEPIYPKEAKRKHLQGSVILHANISTEGKITNLCIVSSPYAILSESSMAGVEQWIYTPYLLNGVPTEVDTTITVGYSIGVAKPKKPKKN
ncbi:MAG: energy transducer TonB [Acidobacteriaceae bacterium]|nr:energy transducer TonB [Acidobacteriaceae bacterium]